MIRQLVASSLRLRTLVAVMAVIVMAVGVFSFDNMPVDVFPEILPVTVNVQTEALGLSAAEVEQLITVPIEADLLTGTPWVDVMRSESVPGLSSIELTFKPGTDPMHARQVVQERLTQAHALPNVSKPPQMLQPLSSTNRIMLVGLSSEKQSLIEMSVLARWTIRPRLMGIPGVANVAIWGQRERQLQVQVDPQRLAKEKVSLLQIVKTAGNALWYSPLSFLESSVAGTGGFIETPNQRIGIRHVLPISKAPDLAKVPVEGGSKKLGDVAVVVENHQPLIGDALNGHGPGLLLVIEKLPGVNTLEVTDDILHALDALKPGLGGIEFSTNIYQPATYVRDAIGNVGLGLLVAFLIMTVMLFALAYDWRAAAVSLVTIPVSLMVAALVIYWSGATMNVMVLAGLVIALGLLIDDQIQLTDGVIRRLRRGTHSSIARALLDSSAELGRPVGFATAIVLLAALPLLFLQGPVGAFLKPLAMSYGIAILASLVVSTLLTPALTMLFLRDAAPAPASTRFGQWLRSNGDRLGPVLAPAAWALLVVAVVAAFVMAPRLHVATAPTFHEADLLVKWDAYPGTSREEMNRIIERVNKELRAVKGVRDVGGHVGRAILSDQVVGIHSAELWVNIDRKADYKATIAAVEDVVSGYPGIDADVLTYLRSRFGEALSRLDEPIVVRLSGQEQPVLYSEADKVRQALTGIEGITDARVHVETTEPVVEIKVDLEAARAHGVKPGDVRRAAATLIAGIEVGNLFEEQKVFEVVVWSEPQVRHSVAAIHDLLIDTPGGGHVRLGDVASVRIVPQPNMIHRENVARTLDVVADVEGKDEAVVAAKVQDMLRKQSFPLEYRAELLGDYARQEQAWKRVLWVTLAVGIGILVLLQAAFQSWRLAFAMLATLPVALAGAVLGAALTGTSLSVGAYAGLLTVLGLAVRHGVLIVHRCGNMRRHGTIAFGPALVARALRDSAPGILMVTIVTAAAVLPFVFLGEKAGFEILAPMAAVILGGLLTALPYTFVVVPMLYQRFGAGVVVEEVDEDDLRVPARPELQRA
jgi:Cu/Ag efflux pump CusA